MKNVLIFAGTLEGRILSRYCVKNDLNTYVSVATDYGKKLLCDIPGLNILSQRMDSEKMSEFIKEKDIDLVVDATHPYAKEVTANIKKACENQGKKYLRFLRKNEDFSGDFVEVDSVKQAAMYLKDKTGNILLTTGSKELKEYTIIPDYKERVFARVLSTVTSAKEAGELGFEGKNLICMQGPFSKEMNVALINMTNAKYLVTKESGRAGGFEEKIDACLETGCKVILVGRSNIDEGLSLEEVKKEICHFFNITPKRNITVLGIGMGNMDNMTVEAQKACKDADLIIGAGRMVENLKIYEKPVFISYKPQEISDYIKEHSEYEYIVVAMSGDVGFYSGTKKLLDFLSEYEVKVLSGISSVVYFASKLQFSWDDAYLASIHGRNENVISAIKNNYKVFSLLGGKDCVKEFAQKLIKYNLSDVTVYVGENLSYENERITKAKPNELLSGEFDALCVVFVINESAKNSVITHGIADEEFIRGKVPMTKEEVRSISLSKLRLTRDSVIYDVGAGTGSVSIEMAKVAREGMVYSIEKKAEALDLIRQNQEKMGVTNLERIEGLAPEAMEDLPVPTHAFIGGSSGNMKEIFALLLKKNPNIRIVVNAIALETVSETLECLKEFEVVDEDIVSVAVGKSKSIGRYHMMMGENPIYIISCTGNGK
ncbi:precorrin-6Y C5,15-methyltransferase (decarboxylating) [Acetitomaculum ruminis DSM 5522]|uniref:Precorrin-6Y C5,15-methyltransferase (Decarboxylating) n=1 Tax=Acetitomaculum ruminis DSM 5522 TaxID=1120918 RepID=A0A1I0WVB0_9FIRM|nr:precorrin-6A reductase [Acetitomaculum ruminis]SFA92591.1 precorrin-6Y C5,15-methyltransferase (decarboxylating) [Acetitomaculum ruminis DSM 5522]